MYPLLKEGDEVLYHPQQNLSPKNIVVAEHPFRSDVKIIKVVQSIDEGGCFFLRGLQSLESEDSRSFGTLRPELIIGRVTSRLPTKESPS